MSICIALLSTTLDMTFLKEACARLSPEIEVRTLPMLGNYNDIDAAICWMPPTGLLTQFPKLQLVQSLGAGVDHILADPAFPTAVPLCRVVDPKASAAMATYVTWALVHHQRDMGAFLAAWHRKEWANSQGRAAPEYKVGIAGMGVMGTRCAQALAALGYNVCGWNRTPRSEPLSGIRLFSGQTELAEFLAGCDALVCLLPLTSETAGFLSQAVFSKLSPGAHIVNVGRGEHLVEADLIEALQNGQIGAATLDVVTIEPLPADHLFRFDHRILITPHIATRSSADVIVSQTLLNLDLVRQGQQPVSLVDLRLGY